MKLSVLMPVLDEAATLTRALDAVLAVDWPCEVELVVVDDGSTDATAAILDARPEPHLVVIHHPTNRGKGAAIATAARAASGTHVIMCDADLEYSPDDIPALLEPLLTGGATVVFGTRSLATNASFSPLYAFGNRLVTGVANVLFRSHLGDLETCFKLLPRELWLELDVRSRGFGMEAEVTGKLLRRGIRPVDVPISYTARSREDGKKLTWRDGATAVLILLRERVRRRPRT